MIYELLGEHNECAPQGLLRVCGELCDTGSVQTLQTMNFEHLVRDSNARTMSYDLRESL